MRPIAMCIVLGSSSLTLAQGLPVFTDTFDTTPSPLWSNTRGDWANANGEYFAQAPSNNPATVTSVPFVLGDLDLDLDVLSVSDGGVWLHLNEAENSGVLLVTGGFGHTGTGFYFHVMTNGSYSPVYAQTPPLFNQGDDLHLTIRVRGSVYRVYLNGSAQPVAEFAHSEPLVGRIGLYDFTVGGQRFDNIVLVNPCLGDFNNSGGTPDDADVVAFFEAWSNGHPLADLNRSGGTPDDADVAAFFERWNNGC